MPGLAHRNDQTFGFWSNHGDDVSFNQLQKFWGELSLQSRQALLRIDKQTLFEQARKNMYCSRCNGLLLEGFLQIVMYGKSLQQEGPTGNLPWKRSGVSKNPNDSGPIIKNVSQDEIQNPSIHPWGGLTTTRDGYLTILDCYLQSKSLKGLQNVFDSARARERDRELLYPDACGGGGRGWISLGVASYGRGHGTRETCALHTARLSCNTLVDFWSALGEETRQSLLRMKEEDFIERLMYRFDSKRFCRDCRRNVIREFKELKELKRMHKEPRCTSWFCAADTAFQYEVSNDTVQADWHQNFADNAGAYHHFEWAIGSGEGKFDIMEFENVGTSGCVQVGGLDLGQLSACHISLRAWRLDGRCTELSVKAHALRGQPCVHCRLIVGDGYITITRGESIKRFFEHAEEAEEEEDDDSMDRDGSDLDGECFRPQKHAKSPELAREFLLDAATVIFKEQVEKAFREGTARQNAHSIFVCLALKLLEERVHVACKEIITIEKQMKLLEEEEKEKREEEERKERRRTKEREKKLRRKERLKEKERQKDKKCQELNHISVLPDAFEEESTLCADTELVSEGGNTTLSRPASPDIKGEQPSSECTTPSLQHDDSDSADAEASKVDSENGTFATEQSKFSRRRLNFWKDDQFDQSFKPYERRRSVALDNGSVNRYESRCKIENFQTSYRSFNGSSRRSMVTMAKANGRSCVKHNEKVQSSYNRNDRYNFNSCCCNQQSEYRAKADPHVSVTTTRAGRDSKSMSKSESTGNTSKQAHQNNKYMQFDSMHEGSERMKSRMVTGNICYRDSVCPKKVWEPAESQKKYPRSSSDSDITLRTSAFESEDSGQHNGCVKSSADKCLSETSVHVGEINQDGIKDDTSRNSGPAVDEGCQNKLHVESHHHCSSQGSVYEEDAHCSTRNFVVDGNQHSAMSILSNSDNCSSCISEGDNNTTGSNHGNFESSSTSGSEDSIQNSHVKGQNGFSKCEENGTTRKQDTDTGECMRKSNCIGNQLDDISKTSGNLLTRAAKSPDNGRSQLNLCSQQGVFPHILNQPVQFPIYQVPSTVGYFAQNLVSWSPSDALVSFPPNHYLYSGPMDYGLKGNSHLCMQYGPMQHVGTPFLNAGTFPVLEPVSVTNAFQSDERTQISRADAAKVAHTETIAKRTVPAKQHSREFVAAVEEKREKGYSSKQQASNTGFSLFHFGGPVALSTGCKSKHLSREDGIVGEFSSQFSADHIDNTDTCNKKESTIEEYNLFAASNGIRFSFF